MKAKEPIRLDRQAAKDAQIYDTLMKRLADPSSTSHAMCNT